MISKYKNKKVNTEEGVFDSMREYKRWILLREREEKGEISNLERQVMYQLMPRLTDENGKFLYHPIRYYADFRYTDNTTGKVVVEDSKGMKTPEYKIKKKLMYWQYKIQIEEV